jgi:hypothetical protein
MSNPMDKEDIWPISVVCNEHFTNIGPKCVNTLQTNSSNHQLAVQMSTSMSTSISHPSIVDKVVLNKRFKAYRQHFTVNSAAISCNATRYNTARICAATEKNIKYIKYKL